MGPVPAVLECHRSGTPMQERVQHALERLQAACLREYGDRLVSLVVFGSVARGTAGPESDIDLLIVADPLPDGRVARVRAFAGVERDLESDLAAARRDGWVVNLSPVFKTPAEVGAGSLLFLDMIEDAIFLHDRGGFMRGSLDGFRQRLTGLGARRVWRGNAWFWDLKPDYKPGEVFEI